MLRTCATVALSLALALPIYGQTLPQPGGPSAFREALTTMGQQLTSEQVLERLLKGFSLLQIGRWWESSSPSEEEALQVVTKAGAQDLIALQGAYLAGGIDAAIKELERQGVTVEKMMPAILEWGKTYPARTFIERSLMADLSEYEVARVLSGEPNLNERLARLQSWADQGKRGDEALAGAMGEASVMDLAEVLLAARLNSEDRSFVFMSLGLPDPGLADRLYRLQDPVRFAALLERNGYTPERFREAMARLTSQVSASEAQPVLAARERAMSRWLQTAGPGVRWVYVGWYERPPQGVDVQQAAAAIEQLPADGIPVNAALEPLLTAPPEMIAVAYQDGTIRLCWRTKEGDPEKVSAYYQARMEGDEPPASLTFKVDYSRLGLLARAKNLTVSELRVLAGGTWAVATIEGKPAVFKRHVGYSAAE